MPFKIHCPNPKCRAALIVREEYVGKVGKCNRCGTRFRIGGDEDPAPSYSEAAKIVAESETLYRDSSGLGERAATECERVAAEVNRVANSARPTLVSTAISFDVKLELKTVQDKLCLAARALREGRDPDGRPISPSAVAGDLGDIILATLGNERWTVPMIFALGDKGWHQLQQVMSRINDVRNSIKS